MATWADIQRGIFAGESGGDYGALFNYQNRPDGQFSNVDLTQMTVDEALRFSDPSGPYAQYVKGQVGRVATPMGAYQVVGTTLRAAKQGLGLTGNERMTPELQDRIGRWIYETQGTGAWEGYKGPRVSTREGSPMDQMQQPQQPMGLMDRLRDPRTRLALSALSRSSVGQRLGQLAASDLQRQQALEDEQRKLGQTQQKDNRTAAWLRTQPSGKSYADAIEKGGIDAKTIYAQYVSDRNDLNSPNVQSSKMLPDNSGSVLTMRDGSLVVKTVGGQTLTGEAAMEFVSKAEAKYVENQQNIFGARRTGTLQADVELGGAAEAAKAEGTVTGKAAGQAKLDLPKIESQGLRTIALIDSILSGPFQDILGPVQGRVKPDTIGAEVAVGRDGIGLIVKLGQLQGTVFLQAFESLKGGGQITELEGAKAEAAAARLNRFQSPQDFAQALNELRDVISEGIRSAQRNAQTGQSVANPYKGTVSFQQGSAPAQGSQPAASEQPATQSDWTDVGGGVRIRKKTP